MTLFFWIEKTKPALTQFREEAFQVQILSDHNLLMMTMKLKLRKRKEQRNCRVKYNLERLKNAECQKEFNTKTGGRFEALMELEEDDIQIPTSEFSRIVSETAMEMQWKSKNKKTTLDDTRDFGCM